MRNSLKHYHSCLFFQFLCVQDYIKLMCYKNRQNINTLMLKSSHYFIFLSNIPHRTPPFVTQKVTEIETKIKNMEGRRV